MRERRVDVLIAGGGVAGLWLAHELRSRGQRVLVASDPARAPASHAAIGLLNPAIGQRFTLAWMAADALRRARNAYLALEQRHGVPLFRDRPIVRILRNREERATWQARSAAIATAGFEIRELSTVPHGFRPLGFGAVEICGAGLVDAWSLVDVLRQSLVADGSLLDARCPPEDVELATDRVTWTSRKVEASALVLAGGAADVAPGGFVTHFVASGLGPALPLRPVKGESLLVRVPGLATDAVYACGHFLAPRADRLWVCGATQVPDTDDGNLTHVGRAELERFLTAHVEGPWTIIEQRVGVRPMTQDLRPIIGRYLKDAPVFVLNGLGSRGIALAPWAAATLASALDGSAPPPDVRPERFALRITPGEGWRAVDVVRSEALRRVHPGDFVIDLTVGTGSDTLWLAKAVGTNGRVLGFDIQAAAIAIARRRIDAAQTALPDGRAPGREGNSGCFPRAKCDARVELFCADHARLAEFLSTADERGRVGVAVANLGSLPASHSPIITRPKSTIAAFTAALDALRPGGALIAAIYVGHDGGPEERAAIERWTRELDEKRWRVAWHRHPTRAQNSAVVLVVEGVNRR